MIRNLIGAKLGAEFAKKSSHVGTGRGAALGALAPLAIARLSLPALVAISAGGYLFKRYRDGKTRQTPAQNPANQTPSGAVRPPVTGA
jgi:ABC-type sugar transport system substrate-binding protein